MLWPFLAALAGGLLSAGLHLTIILGSLGAVILAYLSPLPLFLVGLSFGAGPGVAAGLIGAVIVAIASSNLLAAGAYAVFNAVPVALLCRQALLSRNAAEGVEWYPAGRLMMWIVAYGIGVGMLLLFFLGVSVEELGQTVERALSLELQSMMQASGEQPSGPALAAARFIAPIFPGIAVASWVVMMIANAALAQGLLIRFGRNLRPGVKLSAFRLPEWSVYALAGAGLLSFLSSEFVNFIGINAAFVLSVPFFLAGLGVVHAFAATRRSRIGILAGLYVALAVFGWLAVAIVGLGVADQWADFRNRMAPRAPNRES